MVGTGNYRVDDVVLRVISPLQSPQETTRDTGRPLPANFTLRVGYTFKGRMLLNRASAFFVFMHLLPPTP